MNYLYYLIQSEGLKDKASHDRTKNLGNPVEKGIRNWNVTSHHPSERHGRIYMAARNTARDVYGRGESKCICYGHNH